MVQTLIFSFFYLYYLSESFWIFLHILLDCIIIEKFILISVSFFFHATSIISLTIFWPILASLREGLSRACDSLAVRIRVAGDGTHSHPNLTWDACMSDRQTYSFIENSIEAASGRHPAWCHIMVKTMVSLVPPNFLFLSWSDSQGSFGVEWYCSVHC